MPASNETCTAVELTVTTSVRADFRSYGNVVSTASKFLSEFYGRVLDDPEEASRVAITAHELLENLVKYSDGGESVVEVGLRRRREQPFLCIRTSNHTSPAQLSRLREILDRVSGAVDPVALYYEMIASSPGRKGSGLGLARIAAEAKMQLYYSVRGTEVTILAEAPILRKDTPC